MTNDGIREGEFCLADPVIFKEVYERYYAALKYVIVQYVGDAELACDLLQDINIRLWEKGDKFENEIALKTYLYRVVRNHCLTFLRDSQRKDKRRADMIMEESEESFVQKIIRAEIYALINSVFDELPEACRNVYLKSIEGKSHKEIAEELNITISTIKKHKNNANHFLRERLKGVSRIN